MFWNGKNVKWKNHKFPTVDFMNLNKTEWSRIPSYGFPGWDSAKVRLLLDKIN